MPDAFIHAMPASIPSVRAAGCKWVSGYPENYKKNPPYINGLLILNDPETGVPLSAVCDGLHLDYRHAYQCRHCRGGKYLVNMDSSTIGICGCGVQGRTNVEALKIIIP